MRKIVLFFILVLFIILLFYISADAAVKAFPTAEGFGANTVGGRGGRVMEVTNLNDSGPGSFRDCVENTGPRTCVFRVGGVINLESTIRIYEPSSFLTIAGQTAPGEGVTITPWPIYISYGAHDVIMRYIRHRQGFASAPPNGNNTCGNLFVWGPGSQRVYNIIIDHVSGAWACDDSFQGVGYVTDTTFQWNFIGEPYASVKGDPFGGSKGYITGGNQDEAVNSRVSFHHNLLVHAASRNPAVGPIGTIDFRHNVIYNWSVCTGNVIIGGTDNNIPTDKPTNVNFVGNKYLAGPDTNTDGCWLGELRTESQTHVYTQDNETPWCGAAACPVDTFALGWGNGTSGIMPASEATFRVYVPFAAPSITPTSRSQLESVVSSNAGATKPRRDALDTRLVSELQARSGNVGRLGAPFPSLPTVTSAPQDSDHDGMPDSWESSHGLNPNNGSDGAQTASNGYTNLENYLNDLAGDGMGSGGSTGTSGSK